MEIDQRKRQSCTQRLLKKARHGNRTGYNSLRPPDLRSLQRAGNIRVLGGMTKNKIHYCRNICCTTINRGFSSLPDYGFEVDVELLDQTLSHIEHHGVDVGESFLRLALLHDGVRVQLPIQSA